MRFDCSLNVSLPNYIVWHRWFAWYPVSVEEGGCVWMEWVWRIKRPVQNYYIGGYEWRHKLS